jgi:purine-nucleoside phosphorylase
MSYTDIPYMPKSTVIGHKGTVLVAEYEGKRILCWSGRIHRYEGYRSYKVNYIAHLSAFLGCQYMLITCAAGGGQKGMTPGVLSLLTGYHNLTGIDPLEGRLNLNP